MTLECEFTGIPEPQTKWLISGVELTESDKYHMPQRPRTSVLQITNVTMDDTDMSYTCKAQNPVGEATTTAMLLPQGLSFFFACMDVVEFWQCMVFRAFLDQVCFLVTTEMKSQVGSAVFSQKPALPVLHAM